MNDTFHAPRFWQLLKRTFFENRFTILATLAGFCSIVFLFIPSFNEFQDIRGESTYFPQIDTFLLPLFLCTSFFTMTITDANANVLKGTTFWTLPASYFEKWLCIFLLSIVFMAICISYLKFVDHTMIETYSKRQGAHLKNLKTVSFTDPLILNWLFHFFTISGVIVLGSLYFRTRGAVKAVALFLVFAFILDWLNGKIADVMVAPKFVENFPVFGRNSTWHIGEKQHAYNFAVYSHDAHLLNTFLFAFLPIAVWLIALIRFREKQF